MSRSKETKYLYNAGYFKKSMRFKKNPHRLDKFMDIVKSYNPKKVLDVGCGVGFMVNRMRDEGINAYGTDFTEALVGYWGDSPYFKVAEAEKQPFGDKEFDLVISTDVMEHIHEEDLPYVVEEMKRVGKTVLAFVAVEKKLSKRQLMFHVTNKPLEWWKEHLPGIIVYNSREFE